MECVSTNEEQLQLWLEGKSVHCKRTVPFEVTTYKDGIPTTSHELEECTPDFSCCKPELLAPVEIRESFINADEDTRMKYLMSFLGKAIELEYPAKKVHITDGDYSEFE